MKLALYKEAGVRLPVREMRKLFQALTEEEADPGSQCSINVIFTSDRKIRNLNRGYRNIDRATDVLSFNVDDGAESDGVYAEIYISAARARKQADAYGGSLSEEILRLLCHGLLHSFGYDHGSPRQEKRMKAREQYYLDQVYGAR